MNASSSFLGRPEVLVLLLLAAVALCVLVSLREAFRSASVSTVALRYLRTRPMSWIATGIIVLIVVLYLLIISVMEGFKAHYMTQLQSIHAHLTVRMGNEPDGILEPEGWSAELAGLEGLRAVTAGIEIPAIAIFDKSRTVGTLRGVDLERELQHGRLKEMLSPAHLTAFGEHLSGGKKLKGCIVSESWRRAFKVHLGDHVTFLFTEVPKDADDEGLPRVIAFSVVGFCGGKNDYLENAAYIDRTFLAREMGIPGNAKTLSIWVTGDPDRPDLEEIRMRVREAMTRVLKRDAPGFSDFQDRLLVETWRERYSSFYHAFTRENLIMRFIMGVFLLFVVIIVMLILSRLVAEKIKDIGALRAMGATPQAIRACFLAQGLLVALAGLAAGLPLALLFIRYVNEIAAACGINVFPSSAFLIDRIPTRVLPFDLYLISALTLAAGALGALYPAWRAARLDPVECLRHE